MVPGIRKTNAGLRIGRTTTDKIGFHGKAPVAQRAHANQAAVPMPAWTQTTPYGFETSAQATSLVNLVNEMRTVLVNLGLMKGAA